ncbi:glycosyltransferase family 87 protein [Zafaria sp. J156]|uniref:glycosyltransferase family 87 protein n=1 Tax=Zafaria sp. J156 TaxID=3116490 RepID=UPI002E792F39|nr:glycosyltransferase 87 family protein [Zafaria sp. J156]MEE1620656.1 glycosyltransferase 87 family protein [Zafaria sp. J156]
MTGPVKTLLEARRATRTVVWLLLAATAVGAVLAMLSKQWCRVNGWNGAEQHLHFCYSDFAQLFGTRGLADRLFPFYTGLPAEQAMEYPALLAVVAGVTAFMIPGTGDTAVRQLAYFDLNALLSFGCWAVVVVAVAYAARNRSRDALMVALAPGIILTSTLNWDLWAVMFATLAMLAWARERPVVAGILIGLGTAAKLYPLFLLGAVLVLCWRAGRMRDFWSATGAAVAAWLVVNVPFMLTAYEEWSRFYTFSSEREVSFSSMWLAFTWTGLDGKDFSLVSNGLFALACAGIAYLGLSAARRPRMAQLAFLIVAAFVLLNKVYSPQFVMWLIPLYVLARPKWREFLLWQAIEVFHWAAVWLMSAKIVSGGEVGAGSPLIEILYGAGIAAHMAMVVYLCVKVVGDIRHPARDVVRADGSDDPLAGRLEHRPDAFTLPAAQAR